MLGPILGHASGFSWDEALLVMAPIAIVAGVLFLANQRAKRLGDRTEAPAADPVRDGSPREGEDPPVTQP